MLFSKYPHTELLCSGREVGLPIGFMGNSEVGHMNIGAGRKTYQDMTQIEMSLEDGSFQNNTTINALWREAKKNTGRVHILGLLSDGGVHSHLGHAKELLKQAKAQGIKDIYFHLFLDGRDTAPQSALGYVKDFQEFLKCEGIGKIATVMGRYYAMDRDTRFDRTEIAYNTLVGFCDKQEITAQEGVENAYKQELTDEFILPFCVAEKEYNHEHKHEDIFIKEGDSLFFFNFRADRMRQLVAAFFEKDFIGFDRKKRPQLAYIGSMTQYDKDFIFPAAFRKDDCKNALGEVLARNGKKQLRIAETEKYAHVTYFFDCGNEEPREGQKQILIASPRHIATYDKAPEMSAREVSSTLIAEMENFDVCICNLANCDMVGHTGILPAAIEAVEYVDSCVGRIFEKVKSLQGTLIITADHGNAEKMTDSEGNPHTAHTMNNVPFLLATDVQASDVQASDVQASEKKYTLVEQGVLADIAPTILYLLKIEQPIEMNGKNLIKV